MDAGFPELPYVTAGQPGLGGRIKESPAHFVVEELPLYPPSGEGPHLYLTLRREQQTTRQAAEALARLFQVAVAEIGYAGLKDRDAVTIQTFSLPWAAGETEAARRRAAEGPWEVLAADRHQNKLKPGHLLGNRFTITLSEPLGSLTQARRLIALIAERGLPNYFGPQRFGREGDNMVQGLKLLKSGRRPRSWRDKFLLSSLQSHIYNHYLTRRLEAGFFDRVLGGDLCKKTATGGLFIAEDAEEETGRLQAGEISHTGPLFGRKMMPAKGEAADFEKSVLAELAISEELLAGAGAGDRRASVLRPAGLEVRECPPNFVFTFSLPKGAYATTLMREFSRP